MPYADSSDHSPPPPPRVSRTGVMERSVAAAVISAARQRGLARKPRRPTPSLPSHHRPHGGFFNPWDSATRDGGLRARTQGAGSRTFFHKVAKDKRVPEETLASMLLLMTKPDFQKPQDALIDDKYACASIWIGHCTMLIFVKGLVILTDPVWAARLGPLGPKRLVPPPCEIHDLPQVDVCLLSSACYDHFDKNAVAALKDNVNHWLVPLGLKPLVVSTGISEERVQEMDWWGETEVEGVNIACTPCQANSIRDDTLWSSWVINASHHRVFYCGMTGYRRVHKDMDDPQTWDHRKKYGGASCPVFREISRKYGKMDTAILPIGHYKPRFPTSAVQGDALDMLFVHKDLRARRSVMHRWGTFASNDEGMLDAIRLLENVILNSPVREHEVAYMRHGSMHLT